MLQLPDELIEGIATLAIEHAGDSPARTLALVSRHVRMLSFAPRWRLVRLVSANEVYRFAIFLDNLRKNERAPPVAELLLWVPGCGEVDEDLWALRGLKNVLGRLIQTIMPWLRPQCGDGHQALNWATQRVLAVLAPHLRRIGVAMEHHFETRLPATPFPVLEELSVSTAVSGSPQGFDWLSAVTLPRVRRLHLVLRSSRRIGSALDWRALAATTPGLTHLRLSGFVPDAVPALFTESSPLPPTVQRVVFEPNVKTSWATGPCCVGGTIPTPHLRRVDELPERVRADLRASAGELASRVALVSWSGGPPALLAERLTRHVHAAAIAGEFGSRSGIAPQTWDEGQLVLSHDMEKALAETAGKCWTEVCRHWVLCDGKLRLV
jgi:hypothetical protein